MFNNQETYCDLLEFPHLTLALWPSECGQAKGLTRLNSEFFTAVWFYSPTQPETNWPSEPGKKETHIDTQGKRKILWGFTSESSSPDNQSQAWQLPSGAWDPG